MKSVVLLTILTISTSLWGQVEIVCQNDTCLSNESNLIINNLDDVGVVQSYNLDETLIIRNEPGQTPRDFLGFFNTRDLNGKNINVDLSSKKVEKESANAIIIADSIKNLNVNVNGYEGAIGENSSNVCARNILDGAYGSAVRNAFISRRSDNPSLPMDACDPEDLMNVRDLSAFSCSTNYSEITSVISATRWEKKRQCSTMAGRDLCVAKRINLRCEIFADKINGDTRCCDQVPAPTSSPNWRCDINRCNSRDSGWYLGYQFRMWEEEYKDMALKGHSNEHICNTLTGVSGELEDVFELRNKTYVATAEYENNNGDFLIYPPAGENVISVSYSAGVCGSASMDTSEDFSSFSDWFSTGAGYVRTSGQGRVVHCTGNVADYDEDHYCAQAIQASNDILLCTGDFTQYSPGNQCWQELLPTCSSPNYEEYEEGSYCYNRHLTNCGSRPYSVFPENSFCYNILKERQCGGVASDYLPGSACWTTIINSQNCSLEYYEYAEGSYCYNKKAPSCSHFIGLDIDETPDVELMPHYNFCMTANGINIELFPGPGNCDPSKNYTFYPEGSTCWQERQPTCTGSYTDYAVGSYCYENLKPACSGVYTDYAVGSYCYEKLLPEECTGDINDYPAGSFCYRTLQPASCPGVYSDYTPGTYCFEKLKTACPGVYTDYPPGSHCYRQLEPSCTLNWDQYPEGSHCWRTNQPNCTGEYTEYAVNSYCYNALYPGQSAENTTEQNCAIRTGVGSMCWRDSFPACDIDELEEGEEFPYGSFCWHNQRRSEFCAGEYNDYPRGSFCWTELRETPELYYRSSDFCAISCNWNGSYVSCEVGDPLSQIQHVLTGANYVGQRLPRDAQMSFKIRFTTLTSFGMERNFDVQTNMKVNSP